MPTYRKGEDQFELEHRAVLESEKPVGSYEKYRDDLVQKTLNNPNIKARLITTKDDSVQGPVGSSHLYESTPATFGKKGRPPMEIPTNILTHISGADIMRNRKKNKEG